MNNRTRVVLRLLVVAVNLIAAGVIVGYLCRDAQTENVVFRQKFCQVGDIMGQEDSPFRMRAFKCERSEEYDCILSYHAEVRTSLPIGGWATWIVDDGHEMRVLFESVPTDFPREGVWNDELEMWQYKILLPNASSRRVVVSDSRRDIVVREADRSIISSWQ